LTTLGIDPTDPNLDWDNLSINGTDIKDAVLLQLSPLPVDIPDDALADTNLTTLLAPLGLLKTVNVDIVSLLPSSDPQFLADVETDLKQYTLFDTLNITTDLLELFCSTGGGNGDVDGYCLPKLTYANIPYMEQSKTEQQDLCKQLTTVSLATVEFENTTLASGATEVEVGCCVMEVVDFYSLLSPTFYEEATEDLEGCALNDCNTALKEDVQKKYGGGGGVSDAGVASLILLGVGLGTLLLFVAGLAVRHRIRSGGWFLGHRKLGEDDGASLTDNGGRNSSAPVVVKAEELVRRRRGLLGMWRARRARLQATKHKQMEMQSAPVPAQSDNSAKYRFEQKKLMVVTSEPHTPHPSITRRSSAHNEEQQQHEEHHVGSNNTSGYGHSSPEGYSYAAAHHTNSYEKEVFPFEQQNPGLQLSDQTGLSSLELDETPSQTPFANTLMAAMSMVDNEGFNGHYLTSAHADGEDNQQ